jgi:hypothetical protein
VFYRKQTFRGRVGACLHLQRHKKVWGTLRRLSCCCLPRCRGFEFKCRPARVSCTPPPVWCYVCFMHGPVQVPASPPPLHGGGSCQCGHPPLTHTHTQREQDILCHVCFMHDPTPTPTLTCMVMARVNVSPTPLHTHTVSLCAASRDLYKYLRVGPPLYMVVGPVSVEAASPDVNKLCSIAGCRTDSLAVRVSQPVQGWWQGSFWPCKDRPAGGGGQRGGWVLGRGGRGCTDWVHAGRETWQAVHSSCVQELQISSSVASCLETHST